MLEYENEMLLNLLHQDGLLIGAKGLNIHTIILNLIKVHCDPGNLVFVLCAETPEEEWIIDNLKLEGVTPLPRALSCENSTTDREKIYLQGGVLFVSSRILVVDMLKHKVPLENVTGFIVLRAHNILESCQEAFALRLFRQKNKTGFIKAFSSSPESFMRGFAQVEKIMRALFIKHLYLMPRFQATVKQTLEKRKPDVIELRVNLTSSMQLVQNALLDIAVYMFKELRRTNVGLDVDDIQAEGVFSMHFHRALQYKLDPVWHQLSKATKQLLTDLRTLRHLFVLLLNSNCVMLHSFISTLRSPDYVHNSSGWLLLDEAESLIVNVEERYMKLEQQPKWNVLKEILNEVHTAETQELVFIIVENINTCKEIKKLLTDGSGKIFEEAKRYLSRKNPLSVMKEKEESKKEDSEATGNEVEREEDEEEEEEGEESFMLSQKPNVKEFCPNAVEPTVVIHEFRNSNALSLLTKLKTLKPTSIVFYNADMAAIRQVEVYQCAHSEKQIKVFFMMYAESVEEQDYLATLGREKKVFEHLINEKTNMAVALEQDGKTEEDGEGADANKHRVIVDMREFRSELPVLLHKKGIYIEPVTITVGDYILSPDICVERKSISDLIGSLQSGRLYTQVQQMCRYYAKPLLLIEFDHNKPFELQGNYYLSRDIASKSNDITMKLQLLTLHFPKLRLIWSSGPYNTAQLFFELKQGKDEPNAETAASIGSDKTDANEEFIDKYNANIEDLVSKLPGVTSKNKHTILNKAKSLEHLIKLSQSELNELLQNVEQSRALYLALHDKLEAAGSSSTVKVKKHSRFRATKAIKQSTKK